MTSRLRLLFVVTLLLVISMPEEGVASTFEAQENVPLTRFQLLARSDLVTHIRVVDGEGRYAIVEILALIRGEAPAERLRIDFRDLNYELRGREPVVFRQGEEYILLLQRPAWRKPKEKYRDIFALYHGRRGRIPLPAEGGGAEVESVRELAALVGRTPDDQITGLRALVTSTNQVLRESALEELARLRVADTGDLPALTRLLQDPNARIRVASLTIIRDVMQSPSGETGQAEKRVVLELCRERARNDPSDLVRAGAVRVLGAWSVKDDVAGDLRAISKGDASQSVRYEALRILYLWGMSGQGRQP
jgi:hypothetical protein